MCDCGAPEKTAIHYFFELQTLQRNQTPKFNKLNRLCKDDCDEMEKSIVDTKKLKTKRVENYVN